MNEKEIDHLKDEIKFRVLAEVTASALFIYQGTCFKFVNPAAETLTGYSKDELQEMSLYDLFSEGSQKTIRKMWADIQKKDGLVQQDELHLITRDHEERWINVTASRVTHLRRPAMVITAYDITARKRADLLQDAVYRIAQAADRSKSLDDLYPAIHAIIGEVMTARNFYIALIDQQRNIISYPYYVDEFDPPAESHAPGSGLTEWIFRNGRSLLCDVDTQRHLEDAGEVELIGTPSPIWLGVPLRIENDVIGAMVVQDYDNPLAYGVREQRVLEFVSSQVAMAIKRKDAENALRESEAYSRQRASEMSALYETTRDLAVQKDLSSLLQTIVDRATSLVDAPGGAIYLWRENVKELDLVVAHGERLQPFIGVHFELGEGITGKSARSGEPIMINDYRAWKDRSPKFASLPITAIVATPMIFSGELVGVLTVFEYQSEDPAELRAFNDSEVELLKFFAGAAASAVHNASLFGEIEQRLSELELLYQSSLASSQIHSPTAVAQTIVDTLAHQMHWKGSIWVIEDQKPVLLAYGRDGSSEEEHQAEVDRIRKLIQTLDDGIVGRVCKSGVTISTGNVRFNPYYVISEREIASELCIPLKSAGKTIGCINMESVKKNAFTDHDERLLTTIANHAAVNIENARLFNETSRRAAFQSALNTIIVAATHAGLNLGELLNTALDQILKALGLEIGAIWVTNVPRNSQRVAARGIHPSIGSVMMNSYLMGGFTLEKTLVLPDLSDHEGALTSILSPIGVKAAIISPLLTDGRRIGGLAVASSNPEDWSSEAIAFIEVTAGELGSAAERARLFEETRLRLIELEAVNNVSTALRQAQSIDAMLPSLLDESLTALNAEAGSIWLYNKEKGKLYQVVGKGWCSRIAHLELKPGSGIPGMVFSSSDILFSHDIALDPLTPLPLRELITGGWSSVCVPIRTENETIGVMLVSSQLPREFDGENSRLLLIFSDMAGSAIHRMMLNEKTRRHAFELEERVESRTTELRQALEKAHEADRLKSEFISNINHELRTPLTNLVLYTQMLRSQPTIKTQERIDVIGRELQRLRSLIENLLNLSRLDGGQIRFNPANHDLNSVIRPLAEDRRSLAEEKQITLNIEFQADLPQVSFDESLMIQVISNLLTNALNYTPKGGQVWIRTMKANFQDRDWIGFNVEDTGPGIAEDERERLFERFFRGKASRSSGAPGTGLGLAIVKQVLDRHGGMIEVAETRPGKGATFQVWLPVE